MRRISPAVFVILLFLSVYTPAQSDAKNPWKSLSDALQTAEKLHHPVLVYVFDST